MRNRKWQGFTLVELMIVVVIMGLLASVALPAFTRYIKRSRSVEATMNISRIYQGEFTYNQETHERGLIGSFVAAAATPSTPPSDRKYSANVALWSGSPEWAAIGFALDGPHFYQYSTTASTQSFSVHARGDLDADMILSEFSRTAAITPQGEVQGQPLVYVNELE